MRIYVARHGLTEMNKLRVANAEIDEPLAPEGIEQAKDAAKSIPKTIRHVYSSPQKRAVQTAKILKPDDSITITEIPDLAEIKMGTLSGIAWQDMPNSQEIDRQRRSVQFDYREHGGEAREDVLERVKRFIESIHDKHNDDEVLIVTHGGIIRVLNLLENQEVISGTVGNVSVTVFDTKKILE